MQWIEMIHVRSFNEASKKNALALARELTFNRKPQALKAAALWIRSDLTTDISVMLRWIEDDEQRAYSQVGLQLAEDLGRFGWVTHSVWQDDGYII
jgi:hypothetical protein